MLQGYSISNMVVWESPSSFAVVGESLSPLPATGHYDFEQVSFVRFSIGLQRMSVYLCAIPNCSSFQSYYEGCLFPLVLSHIFRLGI